MQIKLFKDLKKYTLTSTLTKKDLDLVKKYKPGALKKQDAEGNDVFAMSYCEGHPCVSANGITFGSVATEGGFAMITGDLPETLPAGTTYGDYVADKVGAALAYVNEFEAAIPAVVNAIQTERAALLDGIVEA
jgi:hypothetical protein